MKELAIIMPFVGCWEYTREALRTLRTIHPFSLLMIDNKPELEIVEQFKAEHSTIFQDLSNVEECEIMYDRRKPALNVAASWNLGISAARNDRNCKYILIVNNDVLFHPKTIDNLILSIDKIGCGMVTANDKNGSIEDKDIFNLDVKDFSLEDLNPTTNWREEGLGLSCFLIKPDLVDQVGWFDENFNPAYFEDNDFHYRMFLKNVHSKRIPTAPYFHYGSKTIQLNPEIKKNLDDVAFNRNRRYFLNKWGSPFSECMDGNGYLTPFNNPNLTVSDWKGSEKYASL